MDFWAFILKSKQLELACLKSIQNAIGFPKMEELTEKSTGKIKRAINSEKKYFS